MILELKDFLKPAEVVDLIGLSQTLHFVNGRLSNPSNLTKDNLQADLADPRAAQSSKIVADAFARSEPFHDFAFPKRVAAPLLCRYEPGHKYGAHADAAHLTIEGRRMQSDLSATVFIADPGSYQGGELVIHLGTRPVVFKGAPGEVVVYPSTTLHDVRPVRAGARLVSITFIESHVPDERHRNDIFELYEIAALEGAKMDWQNRVRLDVVRQNLLRRWSRS